MARGSDMYVIDCCLSEASDQWADGGADSMPVEGGWGSEEDRTGMQAQPSVAGGAQSTH